MLKLQTACLKLGSGLETYQVPQMADEEDQGASHVEPNMECQADGWRLAAAQFSLRAISTDRSRSPLWEYTRETRMKYRAGRTKNRAKGLALHWEQPVDHIFLYWLSQRLWKEQLPIVETASLSPAWILENRWKIQELVLLHCTTCMERWWFPRLVFQSAETASSSLLLPVLHIDWCVCPWNMTASL